MIRAGMLVAALTATIASDVAAQTALTPRPLARPIELVEAPARPVARAEVAVPLSLSTMSAPVVAQARLLGAQVAVSAPSVTLPYGGLRPVVRPYREPDPVVVIDAFRASVVLPDVAPLAADQFSSLAVAVAYIPPERPEGITQAAEALEAERRRGSVCGDLALQGISRGTVPGPGRCGIENAVEIRSVAGVQLSSPAVIDCQTATTLRRWVENSAIPQFAGQGGGLETIELMGAYSCRTRNNVAGARLSEHSFGRALDIGGFRLRDGTRVTVLNGWNSSWGQRLRAMHAAACGPFGTVLGPEANAAHRNHFHFDTARYRSGSYCR